MPDLWTLHIPWIHTLRLYGLYSPINNRVGDLAALVTLSRLPGRDASGVDPGTAVTPNGLGRASIRQWKACAVVAGYLLSPGKRLRAERLCMHRPTGRRKRALLYTV